MFVSELNPKDKAIILMGIEYNDPQELIKDMNEWAEEEGFFTKPGTMFETIEKIETPLGRTDILCKVKGPGFVNPLKRLQCREMGWIWVEDYIGNHWYAEV